MLAALYILVVILLVGANGFFVASEFALVGVRRSRRACRAQAAPLGAPQARAARRAQRMPPTLEALLPFVGTAALTSASLSSHAGSVLGLS